MLVCTSHKLADQVAVDLEWQLKALPREDIARESIDKYGFIVVVKTLKDAAAVANRIAAEHLELCVEEPFALLPRIKHAGSIFLGMNVPEALGDYFAGPNHTLPTNGTARFSSPLSVDDFVKKSSFLYYDKSALSEAAPKVAAFARCEGLEAHARSVEIRLKGEAKPS
jgi:histidinol dehydrogenase